MTRLRLLFVVVFLAAVAFGAVGPRALEAVPSPPTCNALDFQNCSTPNVIVSCKWASGPSGGCRCKFVSQPIGPPVRVWECFQT